MPVTITSRLRQTLQQSPEKLAVAFNDADFCLRIREKGYLVVWTPSPSYTIWNRPRAGRTLTLARSSIS